MASVISKPGLEQTSQTALSSAPVQSNGPLTFEQWQKKNGGPVLGTNGPYGFANPAIQKQKYEAYKQSFTRGSANENLKAGLRTAITDSQVGLQDELGLLRGEANQALNEGIKNTRQNYNNRGLLYSGLRQSGEQTVRSGVASTLAKQSASAARDAANQQDAYKQQIASIGLKTAQQAQQRAEQIYETNMRNQVARQQAFQQLGQGLGYAGTMAYGLLNDGASAGTGTRQIGGGQYITSAGY